MDVIVAPDIDGYLVTVASPDVLRAYLFDCETGRVELVSEVRL